MAKLTALLSAAIALLASAQFAFVNTEGPQVVQGVAMATFTLTTSGGTGSVTFALDIGSSSLPAGLSLASTGEITGTPTTAGKTDFSVVATDSTSATVTKAFSAYVYVAPAPTAVNPTSSATAGTTVTLQGTDLYWATSVTIDGAACTPISKTSPSDLRQSEISCPLPTPTKAGAVDISIVSPALLAGYTYAGAFTFTPISITTTSITSEIVVNTAYTSTNIAYTDAVGSVTYSSTGTIPTGMTFNTATGVLGGTPSAVGKYDFTITVTDSRTTPSTASQAYTIHVYTTPTVASITPGSSSTAATTITIAGEDLWWTTGVTIDGQACANLQKSTVETNFRVRPITCEIPTPTKGGAVDVVIAATGVTSATVTNGFTFTPISITTTTITSEIATNTAYTSTNIAYANAVGAVTYTSSGTIPGGMTFNTATGDLSGTPTGAGKFDFTITVTDSRATPSTASQAYTIYVYTIPAITSVTPSSGLTGPIVLSGNYLKWATAVHVDGVACASFSVVSSAACTANMAICEVSCTLPTPPSKAGTVAVTATNSVGISTTTGSFTYPAISITTANVANAYLNIPFTATIATSNGAGALTFTVASGSLPAGLSLDGTTGVISGTPTTLSSGAASSFTIQVSDTRTTASVDSKAYTMWVYTVPAISSVTPNSGVTAGMTITLAGTDLYWASSVTVDGVACTSLSLVGSCGADFRICGVTCNIATITKAGQVTVAATNPAGLSTTTGTFDFPAMTITTTSIANAYQNTPFTATIGTQNAAGGRTFTVASGSLPAGLSLDGTTGVISGTPTTLSSGAASSFTIQVSDTRTTASVDSKAYTMWVYTVPVINTVTPSSGVVAGTQITLGGIDLYWSTSVTIDGVSCTNVGPAASCGNDLRTCAITCNLPVPTRVATVTVVATNPAGVSTTTGTFDFPAMAITTTSVANAYLNSAYTFSIATTNAAGGLTFSIDSGSLPAGLSLGPTTGVISGIPTALSSGAASTFTVKVVDTRTVTPSTATSVAYTMWVYTVPAITSVSPNSGLTAGTQITLSGTDLYWASTVTVDGAACTSVSAGSCTGNLRVCDITCNLPTPTKAGAATVAATNPAGLSTTTSIFNFPAITITTSSVDNAYLSTAYTSVAIATSNAVGSVTYSLETGSTLPAGLTLGASTGIISGTPTAVSNGVINSFTIKVTDSRSVTPSTATRTFSMWVYTVPAITSVSPNSGLTAGTQITLSGTDLYWATAVTVDGAACTSISVAASCGVNLRICDIKCNLPTPTKAGAATVSATNPAGVSTTTGTFNYDVMTITAPTLMDVPTGVSYTSAAFTVTNAIGAVTYVVDSGTLPLGLSLSASTGVISGTPTSASTGGVPSTFTVKAIDSRTGTPATVTSQTLTMWAYAIPAISSVTPNTGLTAGTQVTIAGTDLYWTSSVTIDGAVCSGVAVAASCGTNRRNCAITCNLPTPTKDGAATVSATNPAGVSTTTGTFNYPALTIATPSFTDIPMGVAFTSAAYTVTNAVGTVTYTIDSGSLPSGLTLGASTGIISGTPTLLANSFASTFTVRATDSRANAASTATAQPVNIWAYRMPVLSSISPASGAPSAAGSTLTLTGTNLNWATTVTIGGAACASLSVVTVGAKPSYDITCPMPVPSKAGASDVVVVSPAGTLTVPNMFTYTPMTITSTVMPVTELPINVAFAGFTMTVANAVGAVTYTVESGALPLGLHLNSATGVISGSPYVASIYSFTIKATDSRSVTPSTDSKGYMLVVYDVPQVFLLSAPTMVYNLQGVSVVITGLDLKWTTSVTVDNRPCTGITVGTNGNVRQRSISCTLPSGTGAGVVDVVVNSPAGSYLYTGAFTYLTPSITPSVTTTVTPSVTASVTVSSSVTPSVTVSPSVTATRTVTVTTTVTPSSSVTLSVTPSSIPFTAALTMGMTLLGGTADALRAGPAVTLRRGLATLTGVPGATVIVNAVQVNYTTMHTTSLSALSSVAANSTDVQATAGPGAYESVNVTEQEMNRFVATRRLQNGAATCTPLNLAANAQITVPLTKLAISISIPEAFYVSLVANTTYKKAAVAEQVRATLLTNLNNAATVNAAMSDFVTAWSACTGLPASAGVMTYIEKPQVVVNYEPVEERDKIDRVAAGIIVGVGGGMVLALVAVAIWRGCCVRGKKDELPKTAPKAAEAPQASAPPAAAAAAKPAAAHADTKRPVQAFVPVKV